MLIETSLSLTNLESEVFLKEQLITYLGNKRNLLPYLAGAIKHISERLGKKKIKTADLFSGSGVVSRLLKQFSSFIWVNDLELYCEIINHCYLANQSELNLKELKGVHQILLGKLTENKLSPGLIYELYAPRDEQNIKPGERVFYTKRNAMFLDTARKLIETLPESQKPFFLAPLLSEASIHANTCGVFKGFYKNSFNKIGQYGGRNQDALKRILGKITLPFPVFSNFECEYKITRQDCLQLAADLPEFDLIYLDPPYNQHPYGSNYFMLNLLVEYKRPEKTSTVSGIPVDWNRSVFNKRNQALSAFKTLLQSLKTKFLLISFNSEGFLKKADLSNLLSELGKYEIVEINYNAFRASRNLYKRPIHLKEYLYLVEYR